MINLTPIQRTYDQVSVPDAPILGAIWIERDSADNIVGTWYWNGVLWLSTKIITKIGNIVHSANNSNGALIDIATNTFCVEAFTSGRIINSTPHTLAAHLDIYMYAIAEDFSSFTPYLILNTIGRGPQSFNVILPVNQAFLTPISYYNQINATGFSGINTVGVTIGVRYRLIRT